MTSENKDERDYFLSTSLIDSPIAQFDGNDTLNDTTDSQVAITVNNTPDIHTRTAQFELNQRKQTAGIYRDAHLEDFKVIHKDHDKNINIECSSGFYAQVAKPTLSSLIHDPISPVLGFNIVCDNVTKNIDSLGSEYNLTIFFKIIQKNNNTNKVTIHTHNSTRLVQVQGGAAMPDKSTSALWFVRNILYGKFQDQAKAKSYSIASLNKAITNAVESSANQFRRKCGHCDRNFDARSHPVHCSHCLKYFHRTNCHKAHKCACSAQPLANSFPTSSSLTSIVPISMTTVSSPSQQTPVMFSSASTATALNPPVVFTNVVPTIYSTRSTTPAIMSASSPLTATVSSASSSDILPPPLNVDAPAFQHPAAQTRRPKLTQNISTFTPERAKVESLKIELSFARTKIADLKVKNDDQEQTINIYSQKITQLEENRRELLHGKYFKSKESIPAPSSNVSLSLDCKCKIRAQITENMQNISLLSKKLEHEMINNHSHGVSSSTSSSRPSQVQSATSIAPQIGDIPNPSSISSPEQAASTSPRQASQSAESVPATAVTNLDDNDHIQFDEATTAHSVEATNDSDQESDFDFSESFVAPEDSPKIALN